MPILDETEVVTHDITESFRGQRTIFHPLPIKISRKLPAAMLWFDIHRINWLRILIKHIFVIHLVA